MDEHSCSRVFGQLDSNSMSLIYGSPSVSHGSSSGGVSKNSYVKNTNSPVCQNDENTPLKWQQERQEFQFQSNSTPSKKELKKPQQRLLQVRKRRSTLMGAKPRISSRLNNTTSKLDLIDESNLTSLPIPHPKQNEENNIFNTGGISNKKHKVNPTNELRVHNDSVNMCVSYGPSLGDDSMVSRSDDQENASKLEEHPIVLLEDYIPYEDNENINGKRNRRRISLSDLKQKIYKRKNNHAPVKIRKIRHPITSSGLTFSLSSHQVEDSFHISDINEETNTFEEATPMQIPNESSGDIKNVLKGLIHPSTEFNEDMYLSKISKESQLVNCVVCEKVLYELSGLLPERNRYKEIVCGNCAEKYEAAAKLFEDYEFDSSIDMSDFSSMSGMNSDVEILEDIGFTKPNKVNKFSNELLNRLHSQAEQSKDIYRPSTLKKPQLDSNSMLWFIEARKKIKWRWRISGLLPEFLSNKDSNISDLR